MMASSFCTCTCTCACPGGTGDGTESQKFRHLGAQMLRPPLLLPYLQGKSSERLVRGSQRDRGCTFVCVASLFVHSSIFLSQRPRSCMSRGGGWVWKLRDHPHSRSRSVCLSVLCLVFAAVFFKSCFHKVHVFTYRRCVSICCMYRWLGLFAPSTFSIGKFHAIWFFVNMDPRRKVNNIKTLQVLDIQVFFLLPAAEYNALTRSFSWQKKIPSLRNSL